MSSPFGGGGDGGPAAPPPYGQYQNMAPQGYQLPVQHLQAPQQMGSAIGQGVMHHGMFVNSNNNSVEMGSLGGSGFASNASLDFHQLLGGFVPTSGPSGSGSLTLPPGGEALHYYQQQQQQYFSPPHPGMGHAPPAPMFAQGPAVAPAFQLLDPEGKRNRSSGLTNMMVVPDGKAQRVKSGTLQQGPLMAAMGGKGPAAAAAAAAPAPPVEVTKEVKSHTARSLLRMLRAGTGVKTPNNIPITEAENIIMQLAGEFAPVEVMQKKKRNAGREALSVLLTMYLQKPVTMAEAAACFHNPYNRGLEPTQYLFDLLGERTWPPCPEDKPARPPSAAKSRPASKRAVKPKAPVPTFDSGVRQEQQQQQRQMPTAAARAGAAAAALAASSGAPPSSASAFPFSAADGSSSVSPQPLQPASVSYAPPAAIESPFALQTQPPTSPFDQGDEASGEGFGGFKAETSAAAGRTGAPGPLNLTTDEAAKLRDASLSGLLAAQMGIGAPGGAAGGVSGPSGIPSSASAAAAAVAASGIAAAGASSREGGDSALLPSLSGLGSLFGGSAAPSGLGSQSLSGILATDFAFGKAGQSLSGLLPDFTDNPQRTETLSGILSFGENNSSWQEISKASHRGKQGQ